MECQMQLVESVEEDEDGWLPSEILQNELIVIENSKLESASEETSETEETQGNIVDDVRGTAHQYDFVEEHNYPSLNSKTKLEKVHGARGTAIRFRIDDDIAEEAPLRSEKKLRNVSGSTKRYKVVDDQQENTLERVEKVTYVKVASKRRESKEGNATKGATRKTRRRGTARNYDLEDGVAEDESDQFIDNAEPPFYKAKQFGGDKREVQASTDLKLRNGSLSGINQKHPSPKVRKEKVIAHSSTGFGHGFEKQRPSTGVGSTDFSDVGFRPSAGAGTNFRTSMVHPSVAYRVECEIPTQETETGHQTCTANQVNQPESIQTKWTYSGSRTSGDPNYSAQPSGSTSFVLFTICIGLVLLIWLVYGK